MGQLAIWALTVGGILVFLVGVVFSARNVYSVRNLFLAVWLYYGFAIGIDLLMGAELPLIPYEIDLNDRAWWTEIGEVMLLYLACGLAFLATYSLFVRTCEGPTDRTYTFRVPPMSLLVVIHALAANLYTVHLFSMDRMARSAASRELIQVKMLAVAVLFIIALDVILIINSSGWYARLAAGLAILLSLITGDRINVLILALVCVFRWRPAIRGWKTAMICCSLAVFLVVFKVVYGVSLEWWRGEVVDVPLVLESLKFSLSGIDSYASHLISINYLQAECPYWLGRTYVETPFWITWPRFFGAFDVETLAESYIWTNHPEIASRGGGMAFSAIAEAWLNFGVFGPPLLGCLWGGCAAYFDSRPRGIAFYLFLIMTARLFRSDFASLYKNWIVVWGVMFVTVVGLLSLYTALRHAARNTIPTRNRPTIGLQFSRGKSSG